MATKRDIYRVDTQADTSGIKAANQAIRQQQTALNRLVGAAQKAALGMKGLASGMSRLKPLAAGAVRAIGGLTRGIGVLMASGIFLLIGALRSLPGLFGSMRDAVEGATDAVGGSGGASDALDDAADSADNAASSLSDAADSAADSAKKIEGVFGAFGNVQRGFVQAQGRVFDQVEETAESAEAAAESATEALAATEAAVEGAGQATSRFGSALDRISTAWDNAKKTILAAIANALTPALEAFADLLESPAFQEFVKLLAEDLAEAAAAFGEWLIEVGIPALEDWLEEVNEAGGLFDWLKKKWEEFTTRVRTLMLMLTAIILGKLQIMMRQWKSVWENLRKIAKEALEKVKEKVQAIIGDVTAFFANIGSAFRAAFDGLAEYVEAVMRAAGNVVIGYINRMIDSINSLISSYNSMAEALHLPQLGTIPNIPTLQRGGIVESPMLAVVGDNPRSAEVVAPLHELVGIMRQALGGSGTTIHVHVTAGSGVDGAQIGQQIGDSLVREARARGLRL